MKTEGVGTGILSGMMNNVSGVVKKRFELAKLETLDSAGSNKNTSTWN